MLVLSSLLTLDFSTLCCFLLTNRRPIKFYAPSKFYNGWKDFSGILDKHAYGLLNKKCLVWFSYLVFYLYFKCASVSISK